MKNSLYIEITEWQNETFPESTAFSKLAHLREEIDELEEAIEKKDIFSIRRELADCLILLYGAAEKAGLSYELIESGIKQKHRINTMRTWGLPDENGVYKHIKD